MPDKKPTDNEIKKALECCCGIEHDCDKCPYEENNECGELNGILKDALDLINRYEAKLKGQGEKIVIQKGCIDWQAKEINRLQAENERLRNHIKEGIDLAKQIPEMIATAKAEAYKECIDKIQNQIKRNNAISAEWLREYLDNLKELGSEEKTNGQAL